MINEHSNTFQSELNQFVGKINKIFIDTSQETFGNKIYYKEKSSKVNLPWFIPASPAYGVYISQ